MEKQNENEIPKRNVSSVAITIQSNDSDGDSKQTGSDMSNDDVSSDVRNEQTVGLLGGNKTPVDQEIQMGILPDTKPTKGEEEDSDEKNKNVEKSKPITKVLNTPYGSSLSLSGAYVSHYGITKATNGRFKKKVRQLNSFGIFAKKGNNDENTTEIPTETSEVGNLDQAPIGSQANVKEKFSPNEKQNSKDDDEDNNDKQKTQPAAVNGQNPQSNVKIFNAPTNWSHVKSRLFDSDANNIQIKTSPNPRRKSKVGIDDDRDDKTRDSDNEKLRNAVKIFNSPTDYSHVKSRLFDPNAASGNPTNLKPSPSPNSRRKSKVGIEDDDGMKPGENISGDGGDKKRNGVKIFNSSSDYSHVKSRLFDANANQVNSDNLLKPSLNARRKSKVGIEDEGDMNKNDLSQRRGSVKIFNASSDYSHIKSKLFDGSSSSRRSSQVNPEDVNNVNKPVNEAGKENQVSKQRNNVKIFNAPSDYSHVKSRLHDSSNKTNNTVKNKVQEISTLGVLNSTNINEENVSRQNEEATSNV